MLHQQKQTQIAGDTMYLAFRAAFVTTMEAMFAEFQESAPVPNQTGFLDRLPLMAGTALQVQLECLLRAWTKVQAGGPEDFSEIDQCVCYCAAAELANLGSMEDTRRLERAVAGPRSLGSVDCLWLASKLRTIQITWPFEQDCGLTLRDGNYLDGDLDVTHRISLQFGPAGQMLELSGRWSVAPSLLADTAGLASEEELGKLSGFFQHHTRLMNL